MLPPTAIALATHSLEFLVGITGSYAGAGIQYIVPAALVYQARIQAGSSLGSVVSVESMMNKEQNFTFYLLCVSNTGF